MKILKQDIKKGKISVKIDSLDDLWYLSNTIEPNDIIKGKTIRKIKLGVDQQRKQDISKKAVFLKIKVEKIEFHKYSNVLRVSGTIIECPDDISKGSYHTFNVEENSVITIEKEKWLKFQVSRLKEASKEKKSKILILALDRDSATFALIKKYGFDILSEVEGEVEKKQQKSQIKKEFYIEVLNILKDYVKKYKIESIIIGSPAFWKEDLIKIIKQKYPDLSNKITTATCNTTGNNAINEILKRDEIKTVLQQERIQKEVILVEELLREISKENLAVYGFKETKKATETGAIKTLLITDKLIQTLRQKNQYSELDSLLKQAEQLKADIHIISVENDAGTKLQGLGGIGALLRFKIY